MGAWDRLNAAFQAAADMFGPKTGVAFVVGLSWRMGEGKRITPTFQEQGKRLRAHPQIKYGIVKFASDVTHGGFHFVSYSEEAAINQTAPKPQPIAPEPPEEEKKKVEVVENDQATDDSQSDDADQTDDSQPDEATEAEKKRAKEAIKILDDWCEDADVDTWLFDSVIDLRGLGNFVAEKIYEDSKFVRLARVPMMTVSKFKVGASGKVYQLVQDLEGHRNVLKDGRLAKMIHVGWMPIDTGVVGRGVMDSLCLEGPGYSYYTADNTLITENRPPWVEIMEENEDMMRKGVHRTTPRHLYVLKAIGGTEKDSLVNEIKKLRPEDDIVMGLPASQEAAVEVHTIQHASRANIDPQIRYFISGLHMGTMSPKAAMNFGDIQVSEATSRTIDRDGDKDVGGFQRFLRRKLMRLIFREVLEQEGFSSEEVKELGLRMRWGPVTRLEMTIETALSYFQANAVGRNEIREFISRNAGFPLSDKPDFLGVQGGVTPEGTQSSRPADYKKDQTSTDKDEGEGGPAEKEK